MTSDIKLEVPSGEPANDNQDPAKGDPNVEVISEEKMKELNERDFVLSTRDYGVIENVVRRVVVECLQYYLITLPQQVRKEQKFHKLINPH